MSLFLGTGLSLIKVTDDLYTFPVDTGNTSSEQKSISGVFVNLSSDKSSLSSIDYNDGQYDELIESFVGGIPISIYRYKNVNKIATKTLKSNYDEEIEIVLEGKKCKAHKVDNYNYLVV